MTEHQDYPKWVKPHDSHIVRKKLDPIHRGLGSSGGHVIASADGPDHVSTPAFAQYHVDRLTGAVSVLVNDAEEEAKALAEFVAPKNPDDAKATDTQTGA